MRTATSYPLPDSTVIGYRPRRGPKGRSDGLEVERLLKRLEKDFDRLDRKQMKRVVFLAAASFFLDVLEGAET